MSAQLYKGHRAGETPSTLCVTFEVAHVCHPGLLDWEPADWYKANWLRGSHVDRGDGKESGSLQSLLQNGQRRQRVCSPPASPGDPPPRTGYKKKERLTKRFRLSSCQSSVHQCWGDKFCLTKPVITTRALQNKSFVVLHLVLAGTASCIKHYVRSPYCMMNPELVAERKIIDTSFPSSLHRAEAGCSSLIYFAKGKTTSPPRRLRYPRLRHTH